MDFGSHVVPTHRDAVCVCCEEESPTETRPPDSHEAALGAPKSGSGKDAATPASVELGCTLALEPANRSIGSSDDG